MNRSSSAAPTSCAKASGASAHALGPVVCLHRERAAGLLRRLDRGDEPRVRAAENEPRHALRMPQRDLLADHPAKRHAEDVRLLDLEPIQHRHRVVNELGGCVRARCDSRPSTAAVVVGDHASLGR